MAHELARKADGSAAIFSVTETPWHRLGTVLNQPPDTATALQLAGADFEVDLRPVYADVSAESGDSPPRMVPVEGRVATVRLDARQPLGIVSPIYQPLQNHEAFRILDPLIAEGRVTLETGGVLRDGADVWIMAKFDLPDGSAAADFVKREKIAPYFLLANNHSGRRGVLCSLTPIRVVCANTLGMVERRASGGEDRFIRVRHIGRVEERVWEAAMELMESVSRQLDVFTAQQRTLKKAPLPEKEWAEHVLDRLAPFPTPPASRSGQQLYERHLERSLGRRNRLTWLWDNGPGHEGTRSAWEAYQAVTHSIDHDHDHWLAGTTGERRLASLFNGHLAEMKNCTLQRLYDFAQRNTRSN